MILETERLFLMPLTAPQLKLWIEDIDALEKELNIKYKAEPLQGFFLDIVKAQLEETLKDEKNYLYHSFWFIVRKEDRVAVGSADFKDIPDQNGEVEIGYGLDYEFEHNGYMTEAVQAMCDWALKQDSVLHIIAETEINSKKSQNILIRCGFKQYLVGETIWWKL